MVDDILPLLVRANLAASAAILLILAIRRPVARRFGARVAYALWWTPLIAAAANLAPARRIIAAAAPSTATPLAAADPVAATASTIRSVAVDAAFDPGPLLVPLWLAGVAVFAIVVALRQIHFARSLGRLTPSGGVYRAEAPGVGPAVVGTLRPRVVVPSDFEARFSPEEREIVLDHERTHLRRGDPLVNGLVVVLQGLNWFNPLVHLASLHLRLDQELACDAAVIAGRPTARRSYAEAMLKTQLAAMALPLGCHWPARGAQPLKLRIAMLGQALPSAPWRAAGLAIVAALGFAVAVGAWAAQPPQVDVAPAAVGPAAFTGPAPSPMVVADSTPHRRLEPSFDRRDAPGGLRQYLSRDLLRAAAHDEPETAEALIAAGADVNYHQLGDGTPLLEAARRDHVATMRVLLANGADVDRPSPGDGNALIRAARAGQLRAARLLLEHGADVNAHVSGDETPLINAARSDDLQMVRFLVENGADVNLAVRADPWRPLIRSPLGSASAPAVRAYLREHGAGS